MYQMSLCLFDHRLDVRVQLYPKCCGSQIRNQWLTTLECRKDAHPTIPPLESLSVAIVTLPVGFVLSLVFTPIAVALRTIDDAVYLRSAIASGFTLILCCAAWINLIRDVGRGYSPSRYKNIKMLTLLQQTAGMLRTGASLERLEPCEGKLSRTVLRGA